LLALLLQNFLSLAQQYAYFRPFVRERIAGGGGAAYGALDWQDPAALLALTRVLLQHDFGLEFTMPLNHLCPPVPQRLNYVHWIAELIGEPVQVHSPLTDDKRARKDIRGIDVSVCTRLQSTRFTSKFLLLQNRADMCLDPFCVLFFCLSGTGASCIFPLLCVGAYGWNMLGTEVDAESVTSALENVARNRLDDKIEVRHVAEPTRMLQGVLRDDERFDFLMCNPPFFSSLESTGLNPSRSAAATSSELVCPGGEEAFVSQLVRESKALGCRTIRWCSTMLGRKSSLKTLLSLLHSKSVAALVVQQCEFQQGNQTRWGLAWTFDPEERRKREEAMRTPASSAATAVSTTNATAAASVAASPPASSRPTAASSAPLALKSRARLDIRRSGLAQAQVREKLLALIQSYATDQQLDCTLQPPLPTGFEWSVHLRPPPSAASSSLRVGAPFLFAVRVLHFPPSDWLIELEWKKPSISGATTMERTAAQHAFTQFVEHCKQQWDGVFRA
jgi:23S rRNA (adenine1618-N6)-methyltransferase